MGTLAGRLALALSVVTFLGVGALIYLAFYDHVTPLEKQRLIAAEGLGIGPTAYVVVTRELCFSRDGDADVVRILRYVPDDAGEEAIEAQELPSFVLRVNKGCTVRSRRSDIPEFIHEGRWAYESGLRFCNALGRCETAWLPAVTLVVEGQGPRRRLRFELPR